MEDYNHTEKIDSGDNIIYSHLKVDSIPFYSMSEQLHNKCELTSQEIERFRLKEYDLHTIINTMDLFYKKKQKS